MTALLPLAPDFWEWDMPRHRVLGMQFGRRMSIARLPDGALWLHSPIQPTREVVAAVNALGRVAHLVGPNTYHDAFLDDAQAVWPDAPLHGARGLAAMNKKIRVDRTLGDTPDPAWAATFDQHVVRGMPRLNEVVFLHRASRTLIVADLAFNFGPDRGALSQLMFRLYGVHGKFAPSLLLKSVIKDRAAARASIDRILAWDFDRIVVGHGANIETGGQAALRAAYAFLA